MKNSSGPAIFPPNASDAPRAARTGRSVPQKIGSPTPASGPINPIFIPLMAFSSKSFLFAISSSIAAVTPNIGAEIHGCVLNHSKCRFNAAFR